MNQTADRQQGHLPSSIHPTVFVIFGITGDLASRKLIPALLSLYSKGLLPQRFSVIGFSRRSFSREEFREYTRSRLNVRPGQFREEIIKHFFDHVIYEQGMFDDPASYTRLAKRLEETDDRWGQCSNKLFHLSVPPTLYEGVLTRLSHSGLTASCADETGWTRILIEKPFGNDIQTARSLDKLLAKLFKEEQIFRIDHYLAKEALQNILAFRFANSIFEPLWQKEYIDKIHVRLLEKNGVDGRGAFYEGVGALKDVGQNHLLQMLSLVAMERPASFSASDIRRERAKVLSKIIPITPQALQRQVVKGQYEGYTSEAGVSPDSKTETYLRIQTYISSARWKGVPFYLETGKGLAESRTAIDVYFKSQKQTTSTLAQMSGGRRRKKQGGGAVPDLNGTNILTFRIQPDEGIKIRFFVKKPGHGFETEHKTLKFSYGDTPSFADKPNDYERLISDAFSGDQTLFASTDEIMASWKFVTSIMDKWWKLPLVKYPRGASEI